LNARPAGSQGFAAAKAHEKNRNPKNKEREKTQRLLKGDTSNEVSKGTFLKSFDNQKHKP
ncbi:MAG TPA: hypothetical protein VMW51_11805, partial [Terriglobia bacterium]|nr:hypothetical protein [Terriglobia bacterium]